jgi:phage N-6-adenine-methyltransferase
VSLVGFRAQNHGQQVTKRGALDVVDDRGTDPEFFAKMVERFGPFDLDAAASAANAKCERFYTLDDDALTQPWNGRVWCNPPYSNLGAWVFKAHQQYMLGNAELIVMLLPANRTEQAWWQNEVEVGRDKPGGPKVEFLPGRMRFERPGAVIGPKGDRPPFGCCLVIWGQS